MYVPLVGSNKGGRANIHRDERMNHIEYMKVMTGVPLWEGREGGGDRGEEEREGKEEEREGKEDKTEGRKGG